MEELLSVLFSLRPSFSLPRLSGSILPFDHLIHFYFRLLDAMVTSPLVVNTMVVGLLSESLIYGEFQCSQNLRLPHANLLHRRILPCHICNRDFLLHADAQVPVSVRGPDRVSGNLIFYVYRGHSRECTNR